MAEVVMIVGYPAAGKSTLVKKWKDQGFVCLNRDLAGGKIIDLLPFLSKCLGEGKNVVLDNTFPTVESRKPFIEMARKFKAPVTCVWLKTTIEEAQVNACMRMMSLKGKILTPEEIKAEKNPNLFPPVVLFKYKKEFQKPSLNEGFVAVLQESFIREWPEIWTNKAVFFDYDDTLRTSIGEEKWPIHCDDVKILDGRTEKLQELAKDGYMILGVSNQSGIAKGSPTEQQAIDCFLHTNRMLGIPIDYRYCPHKVPPITCFCRKPMPGMAIELFWEYKLDPTKCIMVGDQTSDKTFAQRAGMEFIHADDFFKVGVQS